MSGMADDLNNMGEHAKEKYRRWKERNRKALNLDYAIDINKAIDKMREAVGLEKHGTRA